MISHLEVFGFGFNFTHFRLLGVVYKNISNWLKYNLMFYFYQLLVLKLMSKIREKESLECGRMHIWALKAQRLPGPLSRPWTPAADSSLHSCNSTPLHWQLSALEAGTPFDQILDLRLHGLLPTFVFQSKTHHIWKFELNLLCFQFQKSNDALFWICQLPFVFNTRLSYQRLHV